VTYLQRKLEAFQAKSLLFRTLVVTAAFLVGSTMFVGGISYAVVSAVQGVFHNPELASSAEPNSSPSGDESKTQFPGPFGKQRAERTSTGPSGPGNSGATDPEGLAAEPGPVREKAPATPSSARKVARAPGTTAKRPGERPARGDTPE
jgi:hypothetical protein